MRFVQYGAYRFVTDVQRTNMSGEPIEPFRQGEICCVAETTDGFDGSVTTLDGKQGRVISESCEEIDKQELINSVIHYPGRDCDTDTILLIIDNSEQTLEGVLEVVRKNAHDSEELQVAKVKDFVMHTAPSILSKNGDRRSAWDLQREFSFLREYYNLRYACIARTCQGIYWKGVWRYYQQKLAERVKHKTC